MPPCRNCPNLPGEDAQALGEAGEVLAMAEGLNQKVGQRQEEGQREAQAVESPNQCLPIRRRPGTLISHRVAGTIGSPCRSDCMSRKVKNGRAGARWRALASTPHRISLRHPARLLRCPPPGGSSTGSQVLASRTAPWLGAVGDDKGWLAARTGSNLRSARLRRN